MITYEEALKIICTEGEQRHLSTETIALKDIVGRICAENITAAMANQPFDNSAMDGYALRAKDIAAAANDNPVTLEIIGCAAAGNEPVIVPPEAGQCYEIMTGAALPSGCDTVVPIENTKKDGAQVTFNAPSVENKNIRRAGEDCPKGGLIIVPGTRLDAQHILVLATLGVGQVEVVRQPKIGLISTGLEVVDDMDQELLSGQIYNSTGPYLFSVLPSFGAEPISYGTVPDDVTAYKKVVLQAIEDKVDIILSTGAVSAGAYDFVRSVLEDMGADILLHKVKVRPGKPVLFARLLDNGPLFIGLPGNPAAVVVGARFFVYPLLRQMAGLPLEPGEKAVVINDYTKSKAGFRFFLKAFVKTADMGGREVEILEGQQSFMVRPFVRANVWVAVSENQGGFKAGDIVDVYPLSA